jgi:quinoprotein glucose dehydrogenase
MRALSVFCLAALGCAAQSDYSAWTTYGGSSENIRYSSLKQINAGNVARLRQAWSFDTGDAFEGSEMQCNPIIVDGVMYVTSPKLRLFALDAATGKQLWVFDGLKGARANHRNRGVTYWTDGKQARILIPLGASLYSVNARTGQLDPAFGEKGVVDLRAAFDRPRDLVNLSVSTPGIIYQNLIILGSSVPESLPSTPGDIRAYDVRTGKLSWIFHTIPRPGEFGHDTWPADAWKHTGGSNNWAGMAVDEKRGLVFAPTGSAAFDFYGADRHGDNLFSNTLLCLDAKTGKRKWHYQTIRHDVWDLDFPCPPLLVTVSHRGKPVDAVAQAGKDGYLYLLNRESGESLFPVEERAVPPSTVDGELLATRQKFPLKPAPFSRQEFNEETVTRRTPEAHRLVLERLRNLDHGGRFTPPSLKGTVVFPAFSGGAEWGGGAYDPETHVYYVNTNDMAWILRLIPAKSTGQVARARRIYQSRCASCHRDDLKGTPPEFPAVDKVEAKYSQTQLEELIRKGSGRMPGFASIGDPAIAAVARFLLKREDAEVAVASGPKGPVELKYTMDGYNKFLDHEGFPASTPPWGTLNAINLDTGEYVWKTPLGEYPELSAQGVPLTGTENHGGGVVTAGGLFVIGATPYDRKLRAFDKLTGKLLWETVLSHAVNASVSTYQVKGKQFIVAPAGGGRGRASGGAYVAFALPD